MSDEMLTAMTIQPDLSVGQVANILSNCPPTWRVRGAEDGTLVVGPVPKAKAARS